MSETILYIDGQRVTLPKDLKWTFIDQNPFLSNNGQYTLDITLSLLDKDNARIYGNIQRMNFSGVIPTKRNAVLIVDNKVLLNGTEVVLDKSESEVSIQLVSGNSELNYISGSELNIRSLDLGYELLYGAVIDVDSAQWMIAQMDDPDGKDHFALPFALPESELIGNRWHLYKVSDAEYKIRYSYDGQVLIKVDGVDKGYANVRPQPKLAFLVEKVLEALGYVVVINNLRTHATLKNACLIHGVDTIEWAKMLPSWTVSDFFTQVELFAGCTIVVDNITKEASVLFNYSSDAESLNEIVVTDDYNDEIDPARAVTSYRKKNIGYSLDSDEYYKLASVENNVLSAGEVLDMTAETDPNTILENLFDAVNDAAEATRFSRIFRTKLGDFIAYNDGSITVPKEINLLRPVFNNPDNNEKLDLELKIIPAAMKVVKMPIYSNSVGTLETTSKYYMQLPIVEKFDPLNMSGSGVKTYNMQSLVTGSESISSVELSDKMRIAIFTGRKPVDAYLNTGAVISPSIINHFPVSFVKSLAEYFCNLNTRRWFLENASDKPLAPSKMYSESYSVGKQIDEGQQFVFGFLHKVDLSSRNRFLINGRLYRCLKIEYEINADGFSQLCKGTFYPEL